jgi:hypothetical protein
VNDVKTYDINEQLPVSSERRFPVSPFPRQYVHCIVDELRYAVQAVYVLRAAGYDARDIHVMASWDYVEAAERRYQQQSHLTRILTRILSLLDEDFSNVYLDAAQRGKHILLVRLPAIEHLERVRDLLVSQHAYLIKYVDAWTVTTFQAAPKHPVL